MNIPWLKERLVHGAIYVLVSVAVILALYKLFIKETNKTVYTAPSSHSLENAKYAPFSCAKIYLKKED